MSDTEWEPLLYSLAWVAFREQSLLDKLKEAHRSDYLLSIGTLIAASRCAMGDLEDGPRRRDLRPYIHRVGGPNDAAHRLMKEMASGKIAFRFTNGIVTLDCHPSTWDRSATIFWSSNDLQVTKQAGPFEKAYESNNWHVEQSRYLDLFCFECKIDDRRRRFDPRFSLHCFNGIWKPIPHDESEPDIGAPSYPVMMEDAEARAVRLLTDRFLSLAAELRLAFKREEAKALLDDNRTVLSIRAFDRAWAEARRRVGLPSRAPAGRKPSSKSPRSMA